MKSISNLLTAAVVYLLFIGCAHSEFVPVTDANEKTVIEREWIRNKTLKLTAYYPGKETMKLAEAIIEKKKIKKDDISEILYYSIDDGRHVLFVETDQRDGQVRYHCIGFTKDRIPAVFWVQSQKRVDEMKIETIEKITEPKAEKADAGQNATRPELKPEGGDKPQPESEGRSR